MRLERWYLGAMRVAGSQPNTGLETRATSINPSNCRRRPVLPRLHLRHHHHLAGGFHRISSSLAW